jgi:preprotein translocase subunit SecA
LVTEYLGRILASVSCGDISLLKSLIENENVNDYVQYAALESLTTLVACGEQPREEIMAYYQYLFREKLAREYSHVWDGLVMTSTDLYPQEVFEDIKRAYEDNLVDTDYFIKFAEAQEVLNLGQEKALEKLRNNRRYWLIDDTINELEGWAYFQPPKPRYVAKPEVKVTRRQVVEKKPKIGRNQPCPCGSGKKYKRCCGANL